MKIGDEVYIHGYVDEIRNDIVIIQNDGGYFGTVKQEIIPSADVVEVVRCKDCIDNRCNVDGVADGWCYQHGIDTEPDDYCSYGERIDQ